MDSNIDQCVQRIPNDQRGLQKNPELIDAQLPIGIVEYYASLNPGLIKLGAKLMGISVDRDKALVKN